MALKFNGTSDKVDHGDINALDGTAVFSMAIWIYTTIPADNASHILIAKDGTGGSPIHLFIQGTTAPSPRGFGMTDGATGSAFTSGQISDNTWTHLGLLFNGNASAGSRVSLYINGVSQTIAGDTIGAFLQGNALSLLVGKTVTTGTGIIQVANIKMWNALLTAEELRLEYLAYEPQRALNLVLWAPYDDDGQFARDYSGSGNHGTVTGAVTGDVPVPFRYPAAMTFPSRGAGRRQLKEPRNRFTTPNAGGVGLKIPRKMYG
jgi:hypothetical protein